MVKLRDVAKAVRMDPSTVSRALNDSSEINAETKEYIRSVATELGYKPNKIARALTGKGINTIGIIVPEVFSNHFGQLIDFTAQFLKQRGYSLIISLTHFKLEDEKACIKSMREHSVDGFIFAFPFSVMTAEYLTEFRESSNIPFLLIQPPPEEAFAAFDHIDVDDYAGYCKMIGWLHDISKRRIAWIDDASAAAYRLPCCRCAVDQYGIELKDEDIVKSDIMFEDGGYQSMTKLMERGDFPDVIVCAYDYLALGAMRAASEQGYDVTGELLFCGYDGIRELAYLPYNVPTIVPPYEELARCAVDMLLKRIAKRDDTPESICLRPSFRHK